ncbi:PTS sugar transporter subunit IIA [Clostridium algidicarnis]|uniref:PTS sugar transporter subunit IIA n=1 Tax=Clostridium algidicarnis TaxID=37659 RepID=UPI001C0E4895|nr:PTS glucose transporter subunit IIA [Clostridium algidicarnis]MBU3195384.1 PTS glucose transporter subunit IIA [Clostridium algidicarnis]MBU3208343.1 PTS glucose transporter subunit IIA [Clostridium algidicarnis]MBU3227425.1 PTS glucose transporter subunit IIA [Clostridium algidicarnis]MBU3251168.1 PTS glucose transporter subunit IIA [Clostridium algidicarnis]
MEGNLKLYLPIEGVVKPISEVNDYLFNKKIMGEGIAIEPKGNFLYAPVSGEITLIYEARHALSIKTDSGLQVLIHVGIDSVKLNGKGFAYYVNKGDRVEVGDKILFFDREYIGKYASTTTPIVITNSELISNISFNYKAYKVGDVIMDITLKP